MQTACSACSAKIKVKDELVGKSIKCPKCGKVFKALAPDEENAVKAGAASATKMAPAKGPSKPPPAWDDDEEEDKGSPWDKKSKKDDDEDEDDEDDAKAKKKPIKKEPPPKKRIDDDEDEDEEAGKDEDSAFEDLLKQTTLAPASKKQISSELNLREKGIWIGQPNPKIMTVRGIPKAIGGVFVFFFLAIFASVLGYSGIKDNNPSMAVVAVIGIFALALVFSAVLFGLVLFMERRRAIGTAYVITNKRCITLIPGWFTRPAPTSYYPDLIQHMRRMPSWVFGADSGDIVFRTVTTVTTSYSRRGGSSTSVTTTYYGFLGIRQLDEVEGRIRHALLMDDDDEEDDDEDRRKKKKKKQSKKKRNDDDDD